MQARTLLAVTDIEDPQVREGTEGVTIRRSLVRNLVLLTVATAAAVLGLTIVQSTQAVEELSQALVHRSTRQVHTELDGFFSPVRRQLRIMADWGESGQLTPLAPDPITPLVLPLLRRQSQVSSLVVGNGIGHGYMLLELPDTYRRREVWPGRFDGMARWVELDARGTQLRRWEEELDYDPRTRPWYSVAEEAEGHIAWTEPYTFFTTRDAGITASVTFDDPHSEHQHVAGLDVLLSDISTFTTELEVSQHGLVLVVTDGGQVVGLPRSERFVDQEARREAVLSAIGELDVGPAAAAHRHWLDATPGGERVFSMEHGGERWWVGFRRYSLGPERAFWIQVMVPERDFLAQVNRQRNIMAAIALMALLLAVLMALWLARSYSRPLESLAAHAGRMGALDLEKPEPIDSRLREVRQLSRAQERMRAALDSFARYVPIEVVRELIKVGDVAKLGGRTAELSVMFTDIAGFTTVSERMSPMALTEHMGTYFDAMLGILEEHDATVDKMIGDAIMAFWGAPVAIDGHARRALEAVLACRARLAELETDWEDEGLPNLPTRFGLHHGELVVGNVGSHARLSYTVLGDAVNLAARLEGANKGYGTWVLASSDFVEAVGDGFVWRLVDDIAVKGREQSVEVFTPLGREDEVDDDALELKRAYELAFERYRAADFAGAIKALSGFDDPTAGTLRGRCERLAADPPPEGWEPITRLTAK